MAKPAFLNEDGDGKEDMNEFGGLFVIKLIDTRTKTIIHCEATITEDIREFMENYQPAGGEQAFNHWLSDNGFNFIEIYKVNDYEMMGSSEVTTTKVPVKPSGIEDALATLMNGLDSGDETIN